MRKPKKGEFWEASTHTGRKIFAVEKVEIAPGLLVEIVAYGWEDTKQIHMATVFDLLVKRGWKFLR